MFFATTAHPQLRRQAYANAGQALERFMDDALRSNRKAAHTYEQDDTAFTLSLDTPGIGKDQLAITIEDAVVRISSKEGAARNYRFAYELPQGIDSATSEAKLENGVLTLRLAKKIAASKAAELSIQ
ncbi:MAG: Hsp20/alpha crystallin family protein [Rhodoferax sp.]